MLGFNRRFGDIQGIRALFVRRNPILQPLCAAVGFCDGEVQAQEIVGYTKNTVADFMFIGGNFLKCDGTEFTQISEIPFNIVQDEMEPETGWFPNFDTINILDEVGNCTEQLVYINEIWAEIWTGEEHIPAGSTVQPGWYESAAAGAGDFSDPRNTDDFIFGEALQISVYSGNPDVFINFAGQVKQQPTITDLADFMAIANCTPVDTTLDKLVFSIVEDEMEPETGWFPNFDTINILDEVGNCTEQLVYINEIWAEIWSGEEHIPAGDVQPGWYESAAAGAGDFSAPRGGLEIKTGEGVQVSVYSGNPDVTVQVNSPIAKDAE